MDKGSDSSSYMRMISESHASSSSPLGYTCSTQPSSFHCMKGYRQLAAAYDSTPYETSPPANYASIKQEPIDYTTCENPYEQGMLKTALEKETKSSCFRFGYITCSLQSCKKIFFSYLFLDLIFYLFFDLFFVFFLGDNKINPCIFQR